MIGMEKELTNKIPSFNMLNHTNSIAEKRVKIAALDSLIQIGVETEINEIITISPIYNAAKQPFWCQRCKN